MHCSRFGLLKVLVKESDKSPKGSLPTVNVQLGIIFRSEVPNSTAWYKTLLGSQL